MARPPGKPRLLANKARFHDISRKLSQNGQVSPKYVNKAYHSPCFQNAAQKSPLEILRFPFPDAFSHKELMGRFDPWSKVYCQNDEVSPDVHTRFTPDVTRSGRPDTPTDHAASCLCGLLLIWPQRGILNGPVFRGFAPDYD